LFKTGNIFDRNIYYERTNKKIRDLVIALKKARIFDERLNEY